MAKIGELMQKFIMSNPDRALKFFASRSAEWWERRGEKKALQTFHATAERVPAYKDFLKKHGITDHTKIQTLEDFKKYVPLLTKENYILAYDLKERLAVPYEDLFTISTSSGTMDKPIYWPRTAFQDKMTSRYFELIFRDVYQIHKLSTLAIVAFSLGNYIAGELVNFVVKDIALRNKNKVSVATPGSDLEGVLQILTGFLDKYDQTVIFCYPSLFRILIEEGKKVGINWKNYNVKWCYGGEPCPPKMKAKIKAEVLGEKEDYTFILAVYGAADAGGIGFGNPFTNLLEEIIQTNPKIQEGLRKRGIELEGSLVQVNPLAYFIEEEDDYLIITTGGAVPLVRYNIKDLGEIILFEEMNTILKEGGINIQELLREKLHSYYLMKQPLVLIKGREAAVSLDGANVFHYQVKEIIEKSPHFNSVKIGKKELEGGNVKFAVYLELKKDIQLSSNEIEKLKKEYRDKILNHLLEVNYDFRRSYQDNPTLCDPEIIIRKFGEKEFAPTKSGKFKPIVI